MALVVAVEGLPGAGKTTIIGMMVDDLRNRGLEIGIADIETVGHAPVLRPITRKYPLGHPARILLFWVLRLEQYEAMRGMEGADVVFVDRFWGSTIAYDVYGHGMPRGLLERIGQHIKRQPDITFLFEAPLEVVQKRKEAKTMSNLDFARRVEQGYRELADLHSWVRVDATQTLEQVKKRCLEVVLSRL